MPVVLKRTDEIAAIRRSGLLVEQVHERLAREIRPGVTTADLDQIGYEVISAAGAVPSFLNHRGFPASICTSVNEQLLHGIPGSCKLQEGDIISIDVGVYMDGFHADSARTHPVGQVSDDARKLIALTEECFWVGFREIRIGGRWGDVASVVQRHAEAAGRSVVREYAGHGIGRKMHEDPSVPNYGIAGRGAVLRKGMTFAFEPMIAAGSPETRVLEDNWTVVMCDGALSAHYEHTIAITENGPMILTLSSTDVL